MEGQLQRQEGHYPRCDVSATRVETGGDQKCQQTQGMQNQELLNERQARPSPPYLSMRPKLLGATVGRVEDTVIGRRDEEENRLVM